MKGQGARALLREAGLAPKKSFGQNFLVEERVTRAIAAAAVPEAECGRAVVVELGAGLGALTSALLPRAARLTAVERDRDLVPILARTFDAEIEAKQLTVLAADAQTVDLTALLGPPGPPRVLCGNLPYQITGRLLELAIAHAADVDRVVYMVQEEVADRLVARPSTKAYGALTVFTRVAFDVARLLKVSAGCFHPSPDVASAVIVLTPRTPPRAETAELRAVVKAAFAQRRKTLRNAWGALGPRELLARLAEAAGTTLDARGETLDVDAFLRAAEALRPSGLRETPHSS